MDLCVGDVLLTQWKQGNTCLSKTKKKTFRNRGLFFVLSWKVYQAVRNHYRFRE